MQKFKGLAAGAVFGLLAAAGPVQAQAVRVFVGGAMTPMVRDVGADFTRRTGRPLDVVSDTTGGLQKRLRAGEKADVVVMTAPGLDVMQKENLTRAAGRVDLARLLIGVGIKAGAKSPDISSADAFKASLLAAKSVSYVDPAAGGASGTYFEGLMKQMGVAETMKPRTVYRGQGSEVAAAVAAGEAEMGITFSSEMAPNPGVKVVGPLPPEIQSPTVYGAAIAASTTDAAAAQAFVQTLQGPAGVAALRKASLEPIAQPR
jgi:molybdate transport system substrate-binding protein